MHTGVLRELNELGLTSVDGVIQHAHQRVDARARRAFLAEGQFGQVDLLSAWRTALLLRKADVVRR